jgi:hypothetical protein
MKETTSDVPLHRLFLHYSELPYSLRVLYTAALLVLGLGYLFALIYVFHSYAGRAGGSPWILSYQDLVIAYSGTGKGSRLESALRGPMSTMLPPEQANMLILWAREGATRARYDSEIKPVLDQRCMACHDGSNPHIPRFATYDDVKKVTEQDTGADIFTLVRVSHIHLFGLTFIFFIMGLMYSHAYVRPVWFKCTVIGLPFLAVMMDVSSWYVTKLYHPFAWMVMLAGALMALCFAFMWVTTMYQLWFGRTPPAVLGRTDRGIASVG